MGQIEQRTRFARALVAPPPVVYEELKSYSADVQASPYTAANEVLEASLAARNDPLIDLAIASFGASRETIGDLYRKGKSPPVDGADTQYRQGLRLAVLANETITDGHEKDGEAFVFAAMTNDDVLMNKQQRTVFEEECLNSSHLHRYQWRCEQLHKQ